MTYDYDSRYFIEGNFGYNGSENFAPGHRVGFFPAVAVGWYISNEKFFQPITDYISKLKLKASIGQVGNDQIGDDVRFIYLGTVANTGNYVYGNYNYKGGERVDEIPNEVFSLSKLEELDISNNNIENISNKISKLTNLKKLYINNNKIKSIPKAITELPKLKILSLLDNNLKVISKYIGNINTLEEFYFSSDSLITIENDFYNLENLKRLYIEGNLSSLPSEIYKLKNLKYLYINGMILKS